MSTTLIKHQTCTPTALPHPSYATIHLVQGTGG